MQSSLPLFTVLTPTYNRAHLLPRLYTSLRNQTCRDFEWLVVDDGSTDDTATVVADWQSADSAFPVRYVHQLNAGKVAAMNRGIRDARGNLIAQIDSDDELLPDALQVLLDAWQELDFAARARFVGVTGLCIDDDGRIVGSRYPMDAFVSDSLESRYRYKIRGEKWGFQRRDVLLRFPFPEGLPTRHIPEGVVWNKIAREFKTLYINRPLRIYHAGNDQITRKSVAEVGWTLLIEHAQVLNEELDWFWYAPEEFIRSAVHYVRASLHLQHGVRAQRAGLRGSWAKVLWLLALPLAWLVYQRDIHHAKASR